MYKVLIELPHQGTLQLLRQAVAFKIYICPLEEEAYVMAMDICFFYLIVLKSLTRNIPYISSSVFSAFLHNLFYPDVL